MSAFRKLAVITAVLSLAITGVALAAYSKVTGGTTKITLSSAVTSALSANHLTVTPISPATASGATFTFPIAGGRLDTTTLHGKIRSKGGVTVSNGTQSGTLRQLTVVSNKSGASLWALVRGKTHRVCTVRRHHKVRCVTVSVARSERVATLSDVKVSGSSATATVNLTKASATMINKLAGKQIAKAGDALGTGTIAPTLS